MDSLRLTLLLIGLMLVVGVYLKFRSADDDLILWLKQIFNPTASRSKQNKSENNHVSENDELIPVLSPIEDEPDNEDFDLLNQVISGRGRFEEYSKQTELSFSAVEESSETGPESLLIVLNIMAPEGHVFTGEGIHAVMTSAGLDHAEHQIYHYPQGKDSVFSIANAIEPGYFELSNLKSITTPGLAVFMQLPGALECRKAFDLLIEISTRLADALSGVLCDENRSVLKQQTISHLREKVEAYRLKQQTAQRKKYLVK